MTKAAKLQDNLRFRIKALLVVFIFLLVLSGLTAFPLETELRVLSNYCRDGKSLICHWLLKCYHAIEDVNDNYPFLAYGTDWLAFAHIVIAVAFLGPLRNPFRNIWVIEFGMIACLMVIPLALIAGHIRGIPFFWQMIDCSFGVIGIIPLALCRKYIRQLEVIQTM